MEVQSMENSFIEENSMSVFKSYLRRLLKELKDIEKAFEEKNDDQVRESLKQLIEDTQKGLED